MKKWSALFAFALTASSLSLFAEEEPTAKIQVEITIDCPWSEEYEAFMQGMPEKENPTYEEFAQSFKTNLQALIQLVESGKVHNCSYSIGASAEDDEE